MREHRKIEHCGQHRKYRRAEPRRQPVAALALHLPADACGLAEPDLLHQQSRRQRAEHTYDQQCLINCSIAIPQQCHAPADLAQPCQPKCKQEVKAEACFSFAVIQTSPPFRKQ